MATKHLQSILTTCSTLYSETLKQQTQLCARQATMGSTSGIGHLTHYEQTASTTSVLIQQIKNLIDIITPQTAETHFFSLLSKKIRTAVLDYIRLSKSSASNFMDYKTMSEQREKYKILASCLHGCQSICEIWLQQELNQDEFLKPLDETVLTILQMGFNYANEASSILQVALQGDPLATIEEAANFLECLDNFVVNIRKLSIAQIEEIVPQMLHNEEAILTLSKSVEHQRKSLRKGNLQQAVDRGAQLYETMMDQYTLVILYLLGARQYDTVDCSPRTVMGDSHPRGAVKGGPKSKPTRAISKTASEKQTKTKTVSVSFEKSPISESMGELIPKRSGGSIRKSRTGTTKYKRNTSATLRLNLPTHNSSSEQIVRTRVRN